MTAKASREVTEWGCPHHARLLDPAADTCPTCGEPLQAVTFREERQISWAGELSPGAISEALKFGSDRFFLLSDDRAPDSRKPVEEQRVFQNKVDVLILTALPKELAAVRANSGPWQRAQHAETGFEYWVTHAYHGLTIAASGMNSMGAVSAAVTTSTALTALRPTRVILVGICAGVAPKVRLGDVCVSEQLVDYDLGKISQGKFAPRWNVFQADPELLRSAKHFQGMGWVDTIIAKRPGGSAAVPKVHFGTILTGSKVVADSQMVDSLRSVWTQAIGLEMEGGGTAAAAHQHKTRPSLLLVKGVCDRANAAKNDKWQAYAADAAARYTISLLIQQGSAALEKPVPHALTPKADPFGSFGLTVKQVRAALTDAFNTNGLKNLCHDLNIDWEELEGRGTISGAARDLIDSCKRQRRLEELLKAVEDANPGLFQV